MWRHVTLVCAMTLVLVAAILYGITPDLIDKTIASIGYRAEQSIDPASARWLRLLMAPPLWAGVGLLTGLLWSGRWIRKRKLRSVRAADGLISRPDGAQAEG